MADTSLGGVARFNPLRAPGLDPHGEKCLALASGTPAHSALEAQKMVHFGPSPAPPEVLAAAPRDPLLGLVRINLVLDSVSHACYFWLFFFDFFCNSFNSVNHLGFLSFCRQ